jgi:hemerythrin-like domain-containing protein
MSRHNDDKITRNAEKGVEGEWSPMSPPDAFDPPSIEDFPREELHPFLQGLMDEHEAFTRELAAFEALLGQITEKGISKEVDEGLRQFFRHFDDEIIKHQHIEETGLFPELDRRLLQSGEHSQGPDTFTCVKLMQDEHLKSIQLAAVVFNFFGLAARLPDAASRLVTLDVAIEQGKALVESLRLHMFREDNIIFPLAHKHIDRDTLDQLAS